jgi:nicotinate-nucleotide adenylyltransferase
MDAFYSITSWHRWRAIFDICRLVITTRPGFDKSRIKAHMSAEDYQFFAPVMSTDINAFLAQESSQEVVKILLQSVPQLDISSTQIRNILRDGGDISQWMPAQTYQILRGFINDNR